MKNNLQLGLITIGMLAATYLMPETILPGEKLCYYLSIALNAILARVFIRLVHTTKDKPKGNVNEVMIMTMIRLFASIIFIVIMIKTLADFKWNFVMHFFMIYFTFIIFEIVISLSKLKTDKLK